ncbi:MAG: hypothetical protein ACREJC_19120 [Tepidisphaeraceae bacterium]
MSSQQETPLLTLDADGKKVPWCCAHCGRQRIGVVLNILTKVVLDCVCTKEANAKR